MVRNTTITYGGITPLELALGRRPADVIDVENSNPQQLTVPLSNADKTAHAVRRLAMKSYIEARQSADLRKDIAAHLKFDEGPFQPGQSVWYWQHDPSKIKSNGQFGGNWLKAKLLTFDGSMAGIDIGSRILKVNISKLRKDYDHFADVEVPMIDVEQPNPPKIPQVHDIHQETPDGAGTYASVLWQCVQVGKIDFLEFLSGSARLSQTAAVSGLRVGTPVDFRAGFDEDTSNAQYKAMKIIVDQAPEIVFMSPPKLCRQIINFICKIATYQWTKGRYFVLENAEDSPLWFIKDINALLGGANFTWDTVHMCAYGAKDPLTGVPYHRPTSLLHNMPVDLAAKLFKKCSNGMPHKHHHHHEPLVGSIRGCGLRTEIAKIYPYNFCQVLTRIFTDLLDKPTLDQNTFLIKDLLEDSLSEQELSHFADVLENRSCGQFTFFSDSRLPTEGSIALDPNEPVIRKAIQEISTWNSPCEYILAPDNNLGYMSPFDEYEDNSPEILAKSSFSKGRYFQRRARKCKCNHFCC
jgi:hypothetical protein